jgi:hypothetical protein
MNSRLVARASQRAQRAERAVRALSVAMPVLAYIWRYSFERSKNATLPRYDFTARDRAHTWEML